MKIIEPLLNNQRVSLGHGHITIVTFHSLGIRVYLPFLGINHHICERFENTIKRIYEYC